MYNVTSSLHYGVGSTYLFCAFIWHFIFWYTTHMCDDNQWILNQTADPPEVEHVQL